MVDSCLPAVAVAKNAKKHKLSSHVAGSWDRVKVIIGTGFAAGMSEAIMNIVWMHVFTKHDSLRDVTGRSDRTLLYCVLSLRLLNAALTFLLIAFLEPSAPWLCGAFGGGGSEAAQH
eukprot:Skav215878  [mRNA]  locus=scaffold3660:23026:31530:+ [translate_table: standard]